MAKKGENLTRKVKNLKLVYKDYPQKQLLVALPNPCTTRDYEVEITTSEFTTLCPLNPGQPDYAKLTIQYHPHSHIIELKSLKFYLTSYRTVEMFFEAATNRILDDLVESVKPNKMVLIAEWNVRGGASTKVTASYSKL